MNNEIATKPYLLRALYEWCVDNGYSPYIAVVTDASTHVPPEYVKNGEIVLNIGPLATSRLKIGNEAIVFSARFGGIARDINIPVSRVAAIYARENGQGMSFEVESGVPAAEKGEPARGAPQPTGDPSERPEPPTPPPAGRPTLRRIK